MLEGTFQLQVSAPYEEKIILAGRRGEKFLKQYIASHEKFKNSYFFTSKRLENSEGKGRREIDMIVVTDRKIYVIECKNWSGDVYINEDNWIHKNKINKEQTVANTYDTTTNPVNLNRTKAELLQRTLLANGFFIRQEDIISKVILINKNLRVHGKTDAIDDLILFSDLYPYLSQQDTRVENSLAEKLILSILSLCLDEKHFPIIADGISPCLGGERRKEMIDFLQSLPSWDYLYLTANGIPDTSISDTMPLKVVQGDLLYWHNISIHPVRINYAEIKSVTIKKHKKKLSSLLLVLTGFYPLVLHITMKDGSSRKICGNPNGAVLFHEAGQKEPTQYPLMTLGTIEIQSK